MILNFLRALKIFRIALRYGLDEIALSSLTCPRSAKRLARIMFWRNISAPRGQRLRQALEDLGPIFVKFGQVLSTRSDLLAPDIAKELVKLQDKVPPFDSTLAIQQIEKSLGLHPDLLFAHFEREPLASASIAQVHFATLKNGKEVAVKVLRPNLEQSIDKDLALMRIAANWVHRFWADGKRLKPREVIDEFDRYLHDELDLMREAANASQLRRNFAGSSLLMVPEIYWDYCSTAVIVMERMQGIPVSRIDHLNAAGVDLQKLARDGVEIFFTQVFRDGFFHADMHPGNIFVSVAPDTFGRYIGLDFGIVGTLNDFDKNYLSQNFLAFFQRDYKRVAQAHIESGWAPADTRPDQLEAAVRACREPIFERPLRDISFGQVLLRLFQTSRHFNIEIQPQLVLLQKTLLNIESLGRQLDPDLDLWKTAKPHLERWVNQQIGWRSLLNHYRKEIPYYSKIFPQLPRLTYQALTRLSQPAANDGLLLIELLKKQRRTHFLLSLLLVFIAGLIVYLILR